MRDVLKALRIEAGEQNAGVAVAEIGLSARRVVQLRQRRFGNATGAVAAARRTTPRRSDASLAISTKAAMRARVAAGEMTRRQMALRMEA